MRIAAVLLAAGRSTRFGSEDKLMALLDGIPLGLHAARTLGGLPLAARLAVTGAIERSWPGFEIVRNDQPERGIGRSIALGVAAARRLGAEGVLIALADMPLVSADHFTRVLARGQGPESIAASSNGVNRMPPALFGAAWFDRLERLSGDTGARLLLDQAEIVECVSAELIDIDRPADLAASFGRE